MIYTSSVSTKHLIVLVGMIDIRDEICGDAKPDLTCV
jgi:hypothetical protein